MEECLRIIDRSILKHGYSYNTAKVIKYYVKYYVRGFYCSYTMSILINECLPQLKFIHKYLKKRGRA